MPLGEDRCPGATPGWGQTPQNRDQPCRDTPGQQAAPWDRVTKPHGDSPGWDPSPWHHPGQGAAPRDTLGDTVMPQHGDQHLGVPWRHPEIGTTPMGTPQDGDWHTRTGTSTLGTPWGQCYQVPHLDVVEVDVLQSPIVGLDLPQRLLHVGGIRGLIRHRLVRVGLHHTWSTRVCVGTHMTTHRGTDTWGHVRLHACVVAPR